MPAMFDLLMVTGAIIAVIYLGSAWRRRGSGAREVWMGRGPNEPGAGRWECARPNCHAINPRHAKYCRMCGRILNGKELPANEDGRGTCC